MSWRKEVKVSFKINCDEAGFSKSWSSKQLDQRGFPAPLVDHGGSKKRSCASSGLISSHGKNCFGEYSEKVHPFAINHYFAHIEGASSTENMKIHRAEMIGLARRTF